MPGGRPRTHDDSKVAELVIAFADYIDNTDIPIIVEFAYMNGIDRGVIYDYPEFSTLQKMCTAKKEAQLERMGLSGEIDKTMAIFSLKQLGWSDRQRIDLGTAEGGFHMTVDFVKPGSQDD